MKKSKTDCLIFLKWIKEAHFFKIMRVTFFLLLLGISHVFASATYSQSVKFTFNKKNITIGQLFEEIQKQSEFIIFYKDSDVNLDQEVDVTAKDASIEKILDLALKGVNLNFKVYGRQIVVFPAPTSEISSAENDGSGMIQFQQKRITGKVIDNKGLPLPGVSVVVKGTNIGMMTNPEGEFSLSVPIDAEILQFSFVGMQMQEVVIGTQTNINVTMIHDVIGLEELVVTALGITRDKKSLGYSVGEVGGDELNETPQVGVLNSMQGKVAGVQIAQTYGVRGSSVNMVIRGASSLNSDNQPLFVVDGVPINNTSDNQFNEADLGNAVSDLNTDDIESISVLKGPSAAALYGSRAGNGVVLITTKSGTGKEKGIGVSFNTSVIADVPYKYLPVQNEFASGQDGAFVFENDAYEFWGPKLDNGFMATQRYEDSPSELVSHENNINRQKDFYQVGWTQSNNLAITGNYEKANFRVSLGNYDNTGIMPNIDLKKNNIGINGTMRLTDKLNVTLMTTVNESKSDNRPNVNDSFLTPTRAILTIGPQVDMAPYKNPETWWMEGQTGVVQRRWKERWNNPYLMQEYATTAFNRTHVLNKVQMDWEFINDLHFTAKYLRSYSVQKATNQRPWDTNKQPYGNFDIKNSTSREQNWEGLFSYDKMILNDLDLSANLGGNLRYNYSDNIFNGTTNLVIPGLYNVQNGGPGSVTYTNSWSEKKVNSLFGQVSLGYKKMIYLDLTARNDWSSTLPKDNRSYFYPSASLSMLISDMFDMSEWVTFAKVRAGYAQVGNDVDPYQLQRYYTFGEDWGDAKRASISKVAKNAQLKPEIATSKEIGVDLSFFNNRLSLDATYYVMDNENQVLGIDVPITSGANSKLINAGLVRSKGWDVTLNTSIIRKSDLSFDIGFNFTRNRSTIVELAEGIEYFGYSKGYAYFYTYPGGQVGDIYQAPFYKVEDVNSPYYGMPIIYNNGKPERNRNPDNFEKIGNYNPDFEMGINPSIQYKNFSLTAVFDWRSGGEFYSETLRQGKNDGRFPESINGGADYDPNVDIAQQIRENPDKYINRWIGGRDSQYGGFPWPNEETREYRSYVNASGERVYVNDASFIVGVIEDGEGGYIENFGGPGTIWLSPYNANKGVDRYLASANLYSATYVKLRELSLTYDLPKSIVNKMKLQKLSLALIGQNLFAWTKHNVFVDPETAFTLVNDNDAGKERGYEFYSVIPYTRSIGFKINVEF